MSIQGHNLRTKRQKKKKLFFSVADYINSFARMLVFVFLLSSVFSLRVRSRSIPIHKTDFQNIQSASDFLLNHDLSLSNLDSLISSLSPSRSDVSVAPTVSIPSACLQKNGNGGKKEICENIDGDATEKWIADWRTEENNRRTGNTTKGGKENKEVEGKEKRKQETMRIRKSERKIKLVDAAAVQVDPKGKNKGSNEAKKVSDLLYLIKLETAEQKANENQKKLQKGTNQFLTISPELSSSAALSRAIETALTNVPAPTDAPSYRGNTLEFLTSSTGQVTISYLTFGIFVASSFMIGALLTLFIYFVCPCFKKRSKDGIEYKY